MSERVWPVAFVFLASSLSAYGGAPAFYLPQELQKAPLHFERAKAATVRICGSSESSAGCGTGAFISGEGHLLTAGHVVAGMKEFYIPELGPDAQVRVVIAPKDIDFAIVQVSFPAKSELSAARLPCIPLSPRSPVPGTEVWSVGYPQKMAGAGGLDSDGYHEFVTRALIEPGEEALRTFVSVEKERSRPEDLDFLKNLENRVFVYKAAATHGMSGGPELDSEGQLIGIVNGGFPIASYRDVFKENMDYEFSLRAEEIRAYAGRALGEARAAALFSCRTSRDSYTRGTSDQSRIVQVKKYLEDHKARISGRMAPLWKAWSAQLARNHAASWAKTRGYKGQEANTVATALSRHFLRELELVDFNQKIGERIARWMLSGRWIDPQEADLRDAQAILGGLVTAIAEEALITAWSEASAGGAVPLEQLREDLREAAGRLPDLKP